ncbi:unnamed protein product [Arctia plantaginis]|uniref:Uncharacterized protein n=1 Tax=Arctia plantaginis TaxID=874455 RepID=A0A8S1B7Y1_ARCPL|nr:unnamed protein product [Arctia plantaginis]
MKSKLRGRELTYGIPGVVGCIDGGHFIIVVPPKEEEHLYYSTILVLDRKFNMFHRFINSICTRKEIKKDKRINELTEIIQKRMAMEKANQPGQNSLYPNLDDPSPPGRRKLSGQISPAISLIGLAIANSLGSAKACDDLMFLNSNGLMFRDNTLSESSNGMSIFHVRSSLCLKFQNGSTESITLNKLTRIDRYEAIYKACDFKIESKSTFSCLGSGYCWDEGSGNANSRLQAVGPDACNVPNGQHGCIISPNLSSSGCTHEQICIWYYWKRIPTINKCDPIYELSSSTIIGHMDYTDPKVSADLNQAQPGLFGDMQVQLGNSSAFLYPTWSIQCTPDGSKITCNAAKITKNGFEGFS